MVFAFFITDINDYNVIAENSNFLHYNFVGQKFNTGLTGL